MKVKSRVLKEAFASLLAVFLLLSWGLAPVFAQGATDGTVAGTVSDQQGAVVQSAKITVKNNATGQTLTASASDTGTFRINNVPVGVYTVTIEAQNFKTYSNADVRVQLNRVTDVNATLTPGAVSEIINVTAGAAAELVETTTSQLGKSFDSRLVISLPLSGDQNSLALLTGNVTTQGAGVAGAGGSVGGNRARNNSFTLDGIDNNDPTVTGPQITPIGDAVQEFTILTNQFSAEFGHSSAGQFNTITKTGTNAFHGDAWWYNNNKFFNALDHRFKEDQAANGIFGDKVSRPRFDFNRVGADAGGPIIKDKLFYFGAFQYQTTGSAGSSVTEQVPTAAGFAKLSTLSGISPFTLNILKNHVPPAPAQSGTVDVNGTSIPIGDLVILIPNFNSLYQWHANIDYNASQRDQVRGRFFWDRFRQPNLGSPGAEFNGSGVSDNRLFSLTEIHNFTSTILNEFRFGFRHQTQGFTVTDQFPDFPGSFPNIDIAELNLIIGPQGSSPQGGNVNVYQGSDTVSWIKGRHQMKFGEDFRDIINPIVFLGRIRGEYEFTSLQGFLRDVREDLDFAERGVGTQAFAGNQWASYSFAQDDFKWKPNFTLNLGLRYEYTTITRDTKLQVLNAISNVPADDPTLAKIHQRFPGVWPNGITFGKPTTDKNNWAPRLGFAWAPDFKSGWVHRIFGEQNQSSIRGGFSLAYDVLFANIALNSLPPQFQQVIDADGSSCASGCGPAFGTDVNFLKNGGIPAGAVGKEFFTDKALARTFTANYALNQLTPYTMSWALSVQREFLKNWSLEMRYIGTRGVHLFIQNRLNPVVAPDFRLPTFFNKSEIPSASVLASLPTRADFSAGRHRLLADLGFQSSMTSFDARGDSIYNGGSISVKHRFANGFSIDSAYTLSKVIDDSTNEFFTSVVNPRRPQDLYDLRNERSESVLSHRHRFVTAFVWELPILRNAHGFVAQALGGWQISGIYQVETGQLYNALSFTDANGNGDSFPDRSVVNPNGDAKKGSDVLLVLKNGTTAPRGGASSSQVVGYLAKDANAKFVLAELGANANAGRNILKAAPINNWDTALFKQFRINERFRVEFRAEMFNTFNHPQFTIDNPTATAYAQVSSTKFQDKTLFGGNPRIMNLVLRFHF